MQPKIARKKLRGPRGKRTKKPVPGEDATPPGANTTQAAEDSTAAPMEVDEADVVDEGADELMNILDASLADLGSDDETGGPAPATGTNRVDEEDGDVDVIGTAFPKASKGVKAAMQKTDARRRRRNMATKAWKAFEVYLASLKAYLLHVLGLQACTVCSLVLTLATGPFMVTRCKCTAEGVMHLHSVDAPHCQEHHGQEHHSVGAFHLHWVAATVQG